jgi:hypothetical protein
LKKIFYSKKEKHLWTWVLVVTIGICSSIFLSGLLIEQLTERIHLDLLFFYCFVGMILIIGLGAVLKKEIFHELWIIIGVLFLLFVIILRMGISPAERTHLFENGFLSVLIFNALLERKLNIEFHFHPWLMAIIISTCIGIIDEIIQWFIANRVFDPVDKLFNFIASGLTVVSFIFLSKITTKVKLFMKK